MKPHTDPTRDDARSAEARPAPEPSTVLDWARREGAADRVIADLDRYLRRRRQRRQRAGMAVAAVMLLGGVLWRPWVRTETPARPATMATRDAVVLRPVQRTLPDGSVVELNAGAQIDVDFSGPLRRITLRGGEGHFQVAKDARRPFVVSAGDIEVRAVGTAFAVDWAAQRVEVLVTEGRVAIEHSTPPAHAPANAVPVAPAPLGTLDAGNRMIVTRTEGPSAGAWQSEITAVSALAISQRLAWRVPRLEFAATPLARAVELFNEHAASRGGPLLVLSDPALGRVLLSGVLRADDIESLLRLLEVEFKIQSEPQGDTVVLRR